MKTIYDVATFACFLGVVASYFLLTRRDLRELPYFVVAALVFAVANQMGNADRPTFSLVLIGAGVVYTAVIVLYSRGRSA